VRADVRAADADRRRVADRLGRAHLEGRLDLAEYDEWLRAAWAARTYGELADVTADLPADPGPPPALSPTRGNRRGLHGAVRGWATVSAINLVIWALVCVSSVSWIYPWWIWVAGPWGAVLLAHAIGGQRRSAGPHAYPSRTDKAGSRR